MKTRFDYSDSLLYADMREAFHLGANVLYDEDDGLILELDGKLFAAGSAVETQSTLLGSGMALLHDADMARRLVRSGAFAESLEVMQLVYTAKSIAVTPCEAEIRRLSLSDMDFVLQNYHHPNTKREYIRERIEHLMLGAFVNGAPVGFIGVHAEGAMGLLEVMPPYRNRGIGRCLQTTLMQTLLSKGSIPYCHVIPGNDISLALQRSLGLEKCPVLLSWVCKPEELCF